MTSLNYQMNHILYQIFKIILSILKKKRNENIDNPSTRIYVNKIHNRIIFEIKTGYYFELGTPEKMKLFGSTENKINKDKNCENVPHFEIKEVVLAHCSIINKFYINSFQINQSTVY